jgi:hypothetical protein
MKEATYYLSDISKCRFFKPIRNRIDIIVLLLESIRIIINNINVPEIKSYGKMILHIDKTSRLFYISEKKYFSINFPFLVNNNADENIVYDRYSKNIDSRIISKIMELFLSRNILEANNLVSFFDLFEDVYDEKDIWNIIIELLTFEEGYIRLDDDVDHANQIHPQYHLDIYHKESNKFKLGLNNMISDKQFFDLLESSPCCYFINMDNNT